MATYQQFKRPATTRRCGIIKATVWQNLSERGPLFVTTFSHPFKDQAGTCAGHLNLCNHRMGSPCSPPSPLCSFLISGIASSTAVSGFEPYYVSVSKTPEWVDRLHDLSWGTCSRPNSEIFSRCI